MLISLHRASLETTANRLRLIITGHVSFWNNGKQAASHGYRSSVLLEQRQTGCVSWLQVPCPFGTAANKLRLMITGPVSFCNNGKQAASHYYRSRVLLEQRQTGCVSLLQVPCPFGTTANRLRLMITGPVSFWNNGKQAASHGYRSRVLLKLGNKITVSIGNRFCFAGGFVIYFISCFHITLTTAWGIESAATFPDVISDYYSLPEKGLTYNSRDFDGNGTMWCYSCILSELESVNVLTMRLAVT
jgi:uncharacterized Zn-binding protein involved in type VI secretion